MASIRIQYSGLNEPLLFIILLKIVKKTKLLIILFIVVLMAYGLTTKMYFWQDDSALMFRLQNPVGPMGSFGPSIWQDRGAYRYMVIPFVPFYPLFNLDPVGYFTTALLLYFMAAIAFYFLSKELFQNIKHAFFATLIFSAGYVGSDTMFRIINSWQSNIGLILSISALYLYTKFVNTNKNKYYFLSLALFFACIELVYIRSHSLVASFVILDLVLKKQKNIRSLIIRLFPFISLFYFWYFRDPNFGSPGLPEIGMFTSFFATIGNSLIPTMLSLKTTPFLIFVALTAIFALMIRSINKNRYLFAMCILGNVTLFFVNYILYSQEFYWYKGINAFTSTTIGILMTFNILFIGLLHWLQKNKVGKILIIGYVMLASQIFGYFMQYPSAIFDTTHRYLYFALIGYALVYKALFLVLNKKRYYMFIIALVTVNLLLGINYQRQIIKDRSDPTRVFYSNLLQTIPSIEKGAIFYFDVQDHPYYQKQFGDFFSVGSMPESTALAIYYGLDRDDITFLTNFDELASILSGSPEKLDRVYAFYYGEKGLINETMHFRNTLRSENTIYNTNISKESESKSILTTQNSVDSSTYIKLNLKARIDINPLKFNLIKKDDLSQVDRNKIFLYLKSKENFYRLAKVKSLSEWRYQEVRNVMDNDVNTSWRGHRIYWDDNEHDQLLIEFPNSKIISRIVWSNWIPSLTPTGYTIATSLDGIDWATVSKIENGQEKGAAQVTEEKFNETEAKFVKIDFLSTLTNDSPAISELEIIESKYNDVELRNVEEFLKTPFAYFGDVKEVSREAELLSKITYLKLKFITNKGQITKLLPVGKLNSVNTYDIYFPAGGNDIKEIVIEAENPLSLKIEKANVQNLNLEEMQKLKLIQSFSKN